MDTGTHFVIGISLAGLANIDQVVSQDPTLSQAILLGTLIGSQAPDFDGISRIFGGTSSYLRHHRGISHSFPAIFIWSILISFIISMFYPTVSLFHLWIWTFIACLVHVLLDLFNTYGTQVLQPLSNKWIALNIIYIFDPFILSLHLSALFIWSLQKYNPIIIFSLAFSLTLLYLLWRLLSYHIIFKNIRLIHNLSGKITLIPTIQWSVWNIIQELSTQYNIGVIRNNQLLWLESKQKYKGQKCIEVSKEDAKIKAFLYFTRYAYPEWRKTPFGYEIHWIDLRYRFNYHHPFMAVVLIDESFQIIDSYAGWIYNSKSFSEKIESLIEQNRLNG